MQFSLDRTDPISVVASTALREVGLPYTWRSEADTEGLDGASIVCSAEQGSRMAQLRLDCGALLEMALPLKTQSPVRSAEARTFRTIGLTLLRDLHSHAAGDPELPLVRRLRAAMLALEQAVAGPVFVPERFAYVPAQYFDGEAFGGVDAVYACVLSAATTRLGPKALDEGLVRIPAWRDALVRRPAVRKAHEELLLAGRTGKTK